MKKLCLLFFLLIVFGCKAQKKEKFNLDFEQVKEENKFPEGWIKWGTYDLSIDPEAHSGNKSGKVTSGTEGNFGSIAYKIPANYKGDSIRLEGFMKIRNVKNGFAGLLMRIDANGNTLAFDNMQSKKISGTRGWQKYSITLDYPEGGENIYVAGLLVGSGEAWFDDFVVTIDGKNLQTLQEVEKKLIKPQSDKFHDGSSIEISELSTEEIKRLELLGRVWGFLKYHHPKVAMGKYNWDYELFSFLPDYLEVKDDNEASVLLVSWIDSLGPIVECTTCELPEKNAVLKPDLKWIENQEGSLRKKLVEVYNGRVQGKQHYIEMADMVGNAKFKNEDPYYQFVYPDDGYRLLALYRYWNMINYFFPNKHLMDKDWNTKLCEYLPVFLEAKNELEYELAALQIIADISDTHANLWAGADKIAEWKGKYYAPVHVRFIENELVVTDYYNYELKEEVGLKVGDIITRINGVDVEEIVEESSKYYPASNNPTRLRDISADLLRSGSKKIMIHYISENTDEKSLSLRLYPKDSLDIYRWYRKNDSKSYKMLENNIGYITLQSIKETDIPKIKEEFRNTDGIIIDIRNYPSTFVPFTLGSYFVSSPTPFVKFTKGNINNPGEFNFTKALEILADEEPYKGGLVVLVNELSQSQAEYTAMAFRAGDNTTIIGSTTAGADGNVSTIMLPGGLRTMISGIGVYYPNGKETQRVGIIPDVIVKPTIEEIRTGRDELVEKAIDIILTE